MTVISANNLNATHKKALTYMGAVRPNVRMIAIEILLAAQAAGHNIRVVWGLNPASKPEHSAGTALDFMVYNDRAAGDWISNYVWTHRARLGLRWVIWRQRIRSTSPGKPGTWQRMADWGNSTQNHMDHPHINFWVRSYTPPSGGTVPTNPTAPARKSVATLAQEVIAGKHGNGDARRRSLGSRYAEVQAEVNRRLGGAPSGAGKYRVVTNRAPLNGRAGPGMNYRKTMTAAKGYVLTITEVRNGWAKSTGGHWYSMQYLRKV